MKRVLSIILAIAMCIALLPIFASAADNSVDFSFISNGINLSSVSRAGNRASNSTDTGAVPVVSSGTVHRIITFKNDTSREIAYTPGVTDSSDTILMAGTWEVEIPASGTYVPQINYIGCEYSPKWEIFLTKKPEAADEQLSSDRQTYDLQIDALDSADYVGTYDGYSTSVGALLSKKFIDKSLTAGTYYLTIIANGENAEKELYSEDENKSYLIPLLIESFKLTPATAPARDHDFVLTQVAANNVSYSNDGENNGLQLVTWKTDGVLNRTITDGFALFGRTTKDTSPTLNTEGFHAYICAYDNWAISAKNEDELLSTSNYYTAEKPPYYGIALNVETAGTYNISALNNFALDKNFIKDYLTNTRLAYERTEEEKKGSYNTGAVTNVWIGKLPENFSNKNTIATYTGSAGFTQLNDYDSNDLGETTALGTYDFEAGEYVIIFTSSADSLTKNANVQRRVYTDQSIEVDGVTTSCEKIAYTQHFLLSGITLTPVVTAEDEALAAEQEKYDDVKDAKEAEIAEEVTETGLSDTSYVNIITASVDSADDAFEETTDRIKATRGENVTVTADTVGGYDFLYWRSGLGADAKVITSNPECTVKAIPGTWLTAVYKAEASEEVSVLFYNADGDIIKNELVATDTAITFPSTPTAPAGCGAFIGWALNTKEKIVTSANATGDAMVFVAQFEDPSETQKVYKVTVNGDYDYHAYGEAVTVTATERENGSGSKVFVYWKKGNEIVSFDKKYTFNVWEDCTLTAIYADYKPVTAALRKIIISGNGENIIAEFIGLGCAVETGILFHETATVITLANASHKIAMTTNGNHLAALNDVGNYIGYAILSNGNVIYDK